MERKIIYTKDSYDPIGPFSQAMVVGDFIFTQGFGGLDPETKKVTSGDVEVQAARCMENLKNVLEAAGSSLQDIVKANVYLMNMDDFSKVNAVYAKYMGDNHPPRSCVAVKEMPADELVKVEAIAVKK